MRNGHAPLRRRSEGLHVFTAATQFFYGSRHKQKLNAQKRGTHWKRAKLWNSRKGLNGGLGEKEVRLEQGQDKKLTRDIPWGGAEGIRREIAIDTKESGMNIPVWTPR
jgi:hypothetical protein